MIDRQRHLGSGQPPPEQIRTFEAAAAGQRQRLAIGPYAVHAKAARHEALVSRLLQPRDLESFAQPVQVEPSYFAGAAEREGRGVRVDGAHRSGLDDRAEKVGTGEL